MPRRSKRMTVGERRIKRLMHSRKRKMCRLKAGELRVIKVGWDAVFELLGETVTSNCEEYFDLKDTTKVILSMGLDENRTFQVCAIDTRHTRLNQINFDAQVGYAKENVTTTTDSLILDGHNSSPMYKILNIPEELIYRNDEKR